MTNPPDSAPKSPAATPEEQMTGGSGPREAEWEIERLHAALVRKDKEIERLNRKVNVASNAFITESVILRERAESAEAKLARYEALDAHLPEGFSIGDDATASLAVDLANSQIKLRETEAKLAEAQAVNLQVVGALDNLFALVQGEVPSLLEDDHHFDMVTAALSGDGIGKWRKVFEVAARYSGPHPGLPLETYKADMTYAIGKAFLAALQSGEPGK